MNGNGLSPEELQRLKDFDRGLGLAGVAVDDFWAYLPAHQYLFTPTRELWPASSVNARLRPMHDYKTGKDIPASLWLDVNQAVEQMIWSPGHKMIITDTLVENAGFIRREGCRTFNLYIPPKPPAGDASLATSWLDHIRRIYPDDADHIVRWLAHRVQRPGEKLNHALVLGGKQGIGKDMLLVPVKTAIGDSNFHEVNPTQLLGRFNGFLKSVILRVSEVRDLGDVDRYAFYEHTKTLAAAPPDVLRCDEKNLREHSVINVLGLIFTTNNKANGLYLPPDDRRHYVAWSNASKEEFPPEYFTNLHDWYETGGKGHVAAYLAALDLSSFDPKAPPPKTPAFFDLVAANNAPEEAELADALEQLGNPQAVTLAEIDNPRTDADFRAWLREPRNRRTIPHRMESVGYVPVRNEGAKDGLWKVGKRQVIYAKSSLSVRDRYISAEELYADLSRRR